MSGNSQSPRVVVVDSEGSLDEVVTALRRGGVEDVRTVADVEAAASTGSSIDCLLVPHRPHDGGPDAIELLAVVRDQLGSIPVGVYSSDYDQDRQTLFRLLGAGADTVVRVPPNRPSLLATRVRHLAGVAETEAIEQQFGSFMGHYPEAVYLKDCDGRFVNLTRYAFGGLDDPLIDHEQVVGLTDYELYDRGLADSLFEEEQELLAREETIEDKIEHYVEDGEDRWVSTTKVPRYDAEGDLLGLVGDVRDVTEIKRQERTMATLHRASRRLVRTETKPEVGQTAVDIATEMDRFPQARVDLFDVETGDLLTVAAVGEAIASETMSFRRASVSETAQYRTAPGEYVAVDIDEYDNHEPRFPDGVDTVTGLRIPLGEHGVLGVDAGEGSFDPFTIELAHVLASNTEAALDRAEQERQLAEQAERLEEFAALSSHELRNRLQIAMGTAERARTEEDFTAVDDLVETLGRTNRLVSQLLTLARTGTVTRASESIALSGVCETAWATVGDCDATLSIQDDGIVTADRDGLLEILEILFRTAVESDDCETVRVGTLDEGFFVEDEGSTIESDEYSELFEPTYSDIDASTGDSVYLVSAIAEAHDWTVSVTDGEHGTRFSFGNVDVARVRSDDSE